MGSLLEKFAGKVDLIYIDPPFATGADFSFTAQIGDEEVIKEQSIIEEKAYRDTWGQGTESYLRMMYDRLVLIRELLSETGCVYVHCDWRVNSLIRLVLDEVLGSDNFINEIAWRRANSKTPSNKIAVIHDTLLLYSKGKNYTFNIQFHDYKKGYIEARYPYKDEDGRRYTLQAMYGKGPGPARKFGDKVIQPPPGSHWRWTQDRIDEAMAKGLIVFPRSGDGKPRFKDYLDTKRGIPLQTIWNDIPDVNSQAKERADYPTQKPEALLERIIKISSNDDSIVADFFCGSGTALTTAEKLGRRWIGCDLSRYAIHVARKRLMGIENCKAFEILNLGKYERQVWQGVSFNSRNTETVLYEYLAFILRLYGAEPVAGFQHIHGKKGKALVHVGAVDAPVTINEVQAAIEECKVAGQTELHVLGWEWEMGMYDLITDYAKEFGITLRLRLIPNEVMEVEAVRKGDIRFFELAYLDAKIKKDERKIVVELTDFVIPNTELIPEEFREKIKKWSDYMDYWAVDFNFQNDTFVNQWTSYRTRRDRTLKLKSDPYNYDKPGKYNILVKVIDVFGIDTSQMFEVEVK